MGCILYYGNISATLVVLFFKRIKPDTSLLREKSVIDGQADRRTGAITISPTFSKVGDNYCKKAASFHDPQAIRPHKSVIKLIKISKYVTCNVDIL